MMATGKDVSELFPAVVKNVVSKNIEVYHFQIIHKDLFTEAYK